MLGQPGYNIINISVCIDAGTKLCRNAQKGAWIHENENM